MNHYPLASEASGTSSGKFIYSDDFLRRVQKPARYIGNEIHSVRKDLSEIDCHVGLCFPDVYDVGMSHLGLKILYHIVNSAQRFYAERVFAPWPDMEAVLRTSSTPLRTLETGTPLCKLDILGFSLQYELCAATVLQVLDLGNIPLRSCERKMDDPFVIGGGPVAFNPMPLSPFFDAFAIGDGEEIILELAETYVKWKRNKCSRVHLLHEWKKIPGVFVPPLHEPGEIIHKRTVSDLHCSAFPRTLVIPYCEIVHDRIGIEIARGCTRGCRFCQAGMIYRPVRERDPNEILELAKSLIGTCGWEEISLLSLSSGDYSAIRPLVKAIVEDLSSLKVGVSLPSLRTDTFDREMAEHIRKDKKKQVLLWRQKREQIGCEE